MLRWPQKIPDRSASERLTLSRGVMLQWRLLQHNSRLRTPGSSSCGHKCRCVQNEEMRLSRFVVPQHSDMSSSNMQCGWHCCCREQILLCTCACKFPKVDVRVFWLDQGGHAILTHIASLCRV